MTEETRHNSEQSEARDTVEVIVRGPDGEVKQHMSGGEVRAVAARLEVKEQLQDQKVADLREMVEEHGVEVPKNPTKADLIDLIASRRSPLGIGEILYEGTPQEIKGPGPEWEKDEEGNYVNR